MLISKRKYILKYLLPVCGKRPLCRRATEADPSHEEICLFLFALKHSLHLSLLLSQASQPDELTIDEHEMLEVIEDGDMEDWVKVNTLYNYS